MRDGKIYKISSILIILLFIGSVFTPILNANNNILSIYSNDNSNKLELENDDLIKNDN